MKWIDLTITARSTAPRRGALYIYGALVSRKWDPDSADLTAQELRTLLEGLGPLDELDVYINSPGGSVHQATAIVAQLDRLAGVRKVGHVDALAASAASYIAVSLDELAMHRDAWLMMHEPALGSVGTAADKRKEAELLERMGAQYARAYGAKAGRPPEEMRALMVAEKWLDAQEAVALGLADRVEDAPGDAVALAGWGEMVALADWRHAPAALVARMGTTGIPADTAVATEHSGQVPREGMENMDMERLRAEHPDWVAALQAEGAQQERDRLQALDSLPSLGCEALVQAAKYGEEPTSAEALAVQILRQRAERDAHLGAEALAARAEDAAALALPAHAEAVLPGADDEQERAKSVKQLAALLDKTGR